MWKVMGRIVWVAVILVACRFPALPPIDEGDGGNVDADLQRPQPITVTVVGEGTVTTAPPGIDCGMQCAAEFEPLSTVTLTAAPSASFLFAGWEGDCVGSGDCVLSMDGAKVVTARFVRRGSVRWVKHVSYPEHDHIAAVVTDPQGDVLVAGTVDDGGGGDLFVAKYAASNGQLVWMNHLDTPGLALETFGGLAVDTTGSVYVAARLQGDGNAVSYGAHAVAGDVLGNIVVLRLSGETGGVGWAKQWGGAGQDVPAAIAVFGNDLYVVGKTSSNPAVFDGMSIAAQTGDGFVVRASTSSGSAAAVRRIPGPVDLDAVALNGTNVLVGGAVRASFTLDTCVAAPTGAGSDALLIALAGTTLNCQWVQNLGDTVSGNDAFVRGVAAFPGGGWVIAGVFEGSLSGLGSTALGSRGGTDVFVARLAVDGQRLWSFRYGEGANESVSGIATTQEGDVIFAGAFPGPSLHLGAFTVTGDSNVFVTRMTDAAVPTHEWAVSLGGAESDTADGLAVSADGSVYVVARFSGFTTVGNTPLASQLSDSWLAALVR